MPARRSARRVRGLSGRTGSCRIRAPATSPSIATKTLDDPVSAVCRRTRRTPSGSRSPSPGRIQASLPKAIRRPSTSPRTPCPGRSVTPAGRERGRPRSRAARTTPAARTCCETWSREAASRRTSAAVSPPKVSTPARAGIPMVIVPVLSSSRTRARARASSALPPLTITPRRAARDTPARMAIGAARISGQGVATTSTASARTGSPETAHAIAATPRVSGRKTREKRSARRTKGALAVSASRTRRTIPA